MKILVIVGDYTHNFAKYDLSHKHLSAYVTKNTDKRHKQYDSIDSDPYFIFGRSYALTASLCIYSNSTDMVSSA